MRPAPVIVGLWLAWGISWLAASGWSDATQKRAGSRAEIGYRAVLTLGWAALLVPAHGYDGPLRLWHAGLGGAWICIVLIAVGFAFAWWGRIHLGRLWSGAITKKAGHRVVDTGPYSFVRHPIYTGLLLSILATAGAKGTVLGVVGALLMTIGLWMKARLEERWLAAELDPDAYEAYRRRVPMLVPFGPKSR